MFWSLACEKTEWWGFSWCLSRFDCLINGKLILDCVKFDSRDRFTSVDRDTIKKTTSCIHMHGFSDEPWPIGLFVDCRQIPGFPVAIDDEPSANGNRLAESIAKDGCD